MVIKSVDYWKCKTCHWWNVSKGKMSGQCRANAPMPMTWVMAPEQEIENPKLVTVWPETKPEEGCGSWAKARTK
jgi:hypothetical protein